MDNSPDAELSVSNLTTANCSKPILVTKSSVGFPTTSVVCWQWFLGIEGVYSEGGLGETHQGVRKKAVEVPVERMCRYHATQPPGPFGSETDRSSDRW